LQSQLSGETLKRAFFTLIIFISCLASALASQANEDRVMHFEHWTQQTSQDLMQQARVFQKAHKSDSALLLTNIVAARYDERHGTAEEHRLAIEAMGVSGNIYRQEFSNYPRAYTYLNRAYNLSRKHKMGDLEAYDCIALALLYETEINTTDQPELTDTVISLLKHAYQKAIEIESWPEAVNAAYNMAVCGYARKRLDDVEPELRHFFDLKLPESFGQQNYTRHFCHGILALGKKDYDEALNYFEKMKLAITEKEAGTQTINYLSNCAEVYYQTDRMNEALDRMYQLKAIVEKEDNKYDLMQVYNELYLYYSKMGDMQSARQARLQYLELKTQVQNTERLKQVKDMRFLELLDSVNIQLERMAMANQMQKKVSIGIGVVALLIALILAFLWHAYRQLHRSHEALYQKNRQLLQKEEEERERNRQLLTQLKEAPPATSAETQPKYQSNQLTQEASERIYIKLRQAMTDTTLICDRDFSLRQLSETIGERQRDVSQIINSKMGVNFHTLLNEYRIREACRRIDHAQAYETLTIEALAESVGILSRSNFATAFKRATGLNPSEYIRMAKARKEATEQ